MSRPSGVVLEGETSGPNYGAVNGAQPERTSQRRGASTVLPLGRQTQMLGPDTGDSSGQAVPTVPAGGPVTVSDRAGASVLRLPTGSAERVAVLETERTGPGATEQRQHAHTHVHTAEPQLQAPRPPPPHPKSTIGTSQQPLQPGVSFSPMRERLPPPLQQAVHQLSQQRTAVIQAVQSRAQRALQGARSEHEQAAEGSVFGTPGSLVGSPMTEQPASEDRSAGAWSVTRISEVLHRRFVAPVLEHVGGSDRAPSSSPAWHTPTHGVRDPPLMEPETRRAMAAWTSQPTALTTPIPAPPPPLPRDDSSTGSMNQEVVLEEVRRQVQLAM